MKAAVEQGADPEWIRRMDGLTGLVVDVRPDLPMHTVLRFDIDAVEVEESTDVGVHKPACEGFRSVNEGKCHACGHDGHIAMLPAAVFVTADAVDRFIAVRLYYRSS